MSNNKDRSTILVIVLGFAIIGLLGHKQSIIWTGAAIGCLALLSPVIEGFIIYLWMKLAHVLGWVNTRILLSVTFFIVLVPMSFLKRLFSSSDSLKLKKPASTAWTTRDHLYTTGDMVESF